MRRRTIAPSVLGLSVLAGGATLGQTGPIPEGRPPEWGVDIGYGFPLHMNPGPSNEHQAVLSPSVGFRISSRFELVAAANFERYLTPRGYFVGVLPVGARLSIGHGPYMPYVALGLGFGWTDLSDLPEISRRFNFRIEGAAGLRARVTETDAWVLELRYAHTSNAGTSFPNFGLNSLVLLAGWRFR
jgi:hypothetical protein